MFREFFRNFFSFIFELTKIVIISLAIIIPIRYFLIQPFYVKGASMEPSFSDHEYLIINEISYRFEEPCRGEVIVFRYPKDPREFFIKRVIGLPGEKIQIKDGRVYIYNMDNPSGKALEEPYLLAGTETYNLSSDTVTLGENEYFVLGDNRNQSKDSRSFGAVKRSFITGKVFLRGWPFDRLGFFEEIDYGI